MMDLVKRLSRFEDLMLDAFMRALSTVKLCLLLSKAEGCGM